MSGCGCNTLSQDKSLHVIFRTALKLLVSISATELLIMLVFELIHIETRLTPLTVGLIDALILGVAASVMIFFWVVNPMKSLEALRRSEKALWQSEEKLRENEGQVTEATRRQAEQKLFYESLIRNSAAAVFVLGADHKVILWNRACEELTGVSASEIIGTDDQWKPFYPSRRPVLADLVISGATDEGASLYVAFSRSVLLPEGYHAEGWYHNLGGRNRYIMFEAAPIFDSMGERIAVIESLQDITDRVMKDKALREQFQFLQRLIDTIPNPIFYKDTEGKYLGCNKAFETLLGLSRGRIIGKAVYDLQPGELAERHHQRDVELIMKTGVQVYESQVHGADGATRDVILIKATFTDSAGAMAGLIGTIIDITDRKRLEEQIYRAKQDWEYTFNSITDMVTVHDKDYNIILANKAAEKILDIPLLQKTEGLKCFRYYHGMEAPPRDCPSCGCLQSGKPATFELYEPHLGMFVEIRAIPRLDPGGNLIGLIHVVRDISERKRSEEALKAYSNELTALTRASNTLMMTTSFKDIYQEICDTIHNVFDVSMVWLGLIEAGSHDVRPVAHAGHEDGYLSTIRVTWDDAPSGMGPSGIAIKTKQPYGMLVDSREFEPWRAEATKRGYVSRLAVPLILTGDVCIGVLNFYGGDPDYFTPDKVKLLQLFANQAATAIENVQLVEGLEARVRERTREIEDANVELQAVNKELELRRMEAESASRSKSDFLANMSHELRTPLNAIMGFSEIIMVGMVGQINEKQKEFMGDIYRSGQHLLTLINDILDLSKIEAGKMDLDLSRFDLKEVVEGSLVMFKEKALKHGISMESAVEQKAVVADRRKIKQVIVNLLSNAFKFTADGGAVSVQACWWDRARLKEAEAVAGTVSDDTLDHLLKFASACEDFVEISVTDTGIGILEEDQRGLFQPFRQIETSLTRKYSGTGLGLSLCKRFVELHAGMIWVESSEGEGSRFAFLIPSAQKGEPGN